MASQRFKREPLTKRFVLGLRASLIMLPLLGVTWLFGILTMTSASVVFNYIFAVLNSLQGVLVFLFHCVLNKQVRYILNYFRKNLQSCTAVVWSSVNLFCFGRALLSQLCVSTWLLSALGLPFQLYDIFQVREVVQDARRPVVATASTFRSKNNPNSPSK